jgi:type I restriction enzyme, S subunit
MVRNVPTLRFNGFNDEWSEKKLNEVSTYHASNLTLRSVKTKGDVPLYDANGLIGFTKTNPIREKYVSIIKDGAGVGRIRLLPKNSSIIATMGALLPKDINIDFFYQMLLNYDFSRFITGTTIPHIYFNTYGDSEVKYPSEIEQIKISVTLKKIDTLITLHQQKHEKLINVKKALLDKMFPKNGEVIPSLRFKGFVDEWEPTKLGKLGIIVTGNTPPTSNPNYYSIEGIPWVTPTDISQNITTHSERMLSKEGQTVARVVPTNTILVTCIASIGKNTLLGTVGSFNQQINALIPNPNHDKYFLYTQSSHWSNHMKRMGGGLTFQIVNKKEFSVIDTTIPNFAEQKKVGDLFNKIDSLINLYKQKHEKLINVKRALLQKMFV